MVVNVENVVAGVEGHVPVRVAEAARELVQFRPVRPAAKNRPGTEHGSPATVGAFDGVVDGAGGDVEPAVVAQGQAGNLPKAPTAEPVGDDFRLRRPRTAEVGQAVAAHAAA